MRFLTNSLLSASIVLIPMVSHAADVRSSHEVAARQLVIAVGGAEMAQAGAEAMLGPVRENPELAPYEDVFVAWFKKVFTSGDFEGEMAAIYMKYFTEQELRDLTAFYATPLGRKTLSSLPQVMQEGADLGTRRANEHESELIEMLDAAKAARKAKAEGGSQ